MLKKDFFRSVFLSLSFASLVFAFQNCTNPFHSQNAFISNVKPQTLKGSTVAPTGTDSLKVNSKSAQ